MDLHHGHFVTFAAQFKSMPNIYSVIMAGGIGSRFWPVSTSKYPKQFHDIIGTGETLIQQTFRRLKKISDPKHILVVTHRNYRDLVLKQLPEIPEENVILEPARRNTAPCITYAAYRIAANDPTAVMLVAPSDHLISNEDEFIRVSKIAADKASASRKLFTLGIRPNRPDTGYGYIQYIDLPEDADSEVKKVKTFTEKPDIQMAKEFLASGDFLWNSGIFIWSIDTFMQEISEHLSDLYSTFESGLEHFGKETEKAFMEEVYPASENESIDYGLLEKSSHVYVIPSDFGWSDLGTWGSLHSHIEPDEHGNSKLNDTILSFDTSNSIIKVPKGKLAVIEGLDGYIVVDKDDALLICKMENEQLIKSFVSEIKLQYGDKYL